METKPIKQITIKSESGYVIVTAAYHDRLVITKESIRYEYKPWVEMEENPAWRWSYSTQDPAFRKAFGELEKLV